MSKQFIELTSTETISGCNCGDNCKCGTKAQSSTSCGGPGCC